MNLENLHELINRYTANYHIVNDSEHNEIFKWAAVKQFRNVWFSDDAKNLTFSQMFNAARKESAVLIDNSQVSPTNGIVKIAKKAPAEVEHLFRDVLFADEDDANKIQDNMDAFLDGIEQLREHYYPQSWKFKQDRHAASCYLAFYAPEKHFIYRYSEAEEFAKYIEFGRDIGSGENFSLSNYYELCNLVVSALKEHTDLIDAYKALIGGNDKYYFDKSLHLMAFDFMYCCRCYNFYTGLEHKAKRESIKEYKLEQLRVKEKNEYEEKLRSLEARIHDIEMQLDSYREISILNVEVDYTGCGRGIVVAQEANKITVRFSDCVKTFAINKKYPKRPTFEDDEEIVEAFTHYDDLERQLRSLDAELRRLKSNY